MKETEDLMITASKELENAYWNLRNVECARDLDRNIYHAVRILRRIVSNAHVSLCDILKEMEWRESRE